MLQRRWRRHRSLFSSPVPRGVQKPKIRWKILPVLWLAFKRLCFVIGASILLSAVIGAYMASRVTSQHTIPTLPDQIVLYFEFEGDLRENPVPGSLAGSFGPTAPTVHEVVEALDRGAADPRVKGFMGRLEDGDLSLSHVQALRAAIKRFREAGKFAYIYSPSFGGAGSGLGRYYLASAFEERWMQPLGVVSIAGIKAEVPFFRDTLDKIGLLPQFYQRKAYKTAYESVTNRQMSPENREEIGDLVSAIRAEIMTDVPADLGMEPAAFEGLVNKGLLTAQEAEQAGLITHADYADVLVERITETLLGDPESEEELFVGLTQYSAIAMREEGQRNLVRSFARSRKQVALIYAIGPIMSTNGQGGPSPLGGSGIAAADEIAPAILEAADDEAIGAIVIRIDSPGGSPVASESILRAIERAKIKGKKVIVSMGATAASGGYWIAAYADQIFVAPITITGSIGVVGGKVSGGALSDKLGVNWDSVEWGRNAGIWSFTTPFSASEAERVNAMMDQVYDAFVERVAKGRGKTEAEVEKVAQGRIWTGREAVKIGLADQIGDLREAMDYTAQILGGKDRHDLSVVILPRPRSPLEQVLLFLEQQGAVWSGLSAQAGLVSPAVQVVGPALRDAAVLQEAETPVIVYEPLQLR